MSIDFSCSGCSRQFSVAESMAGTQAQCNTCGAVLVIPNPTPQVPQTPLAPQQPSPAPTYEAPAAPQPAPLQQAFPTEPVFPQAPAMPNYQPTLQQPPWAQPRTPTNWKKIRRVCLMVGGSVLGVAAVIGIVVGVIYAIPRMDDIIAEARVAGSGAISPSQALKAKWRYLAEPDCAALYYSYDEGSREYLDNQAQRNNLEDGIALLKKVLDPETSEEQSGEIPDELKDKLREEGEKLRKSVRENVNKATFTDDILGDVAMVRVKYAGAMGESEMGYAFLREGGVWRQEITGFERLMFAQGATEFRSGRFGISAPRIPRYRSRFIEKWRKAVEALPADKRMERTFQSLRGTLVFVNIPGGVRAKAPKLEEHERPAAAKVCEKYLNDEDMKIVRAAADLLGQVGSSENVPALVSRLNSNDALLKQSCLRSLARIGDVSAIQPIVETLPDRSTGRELSKALVALGPQSESAVWPFLKHSEYVVQIRAVDVLGDVGTAASIQQLEQYKNETTKAASMVNRSIAKIRQRVGG